MLLFFAAFKTLPTIDFKCFIYKKSYSNFSNFPHSKKKKKHSKSLLNLKTIYSSVQICYKHILITNYVICLLELCISLFLAVSKSQFPQWGSRVKRLETWSINLDKYFGPTGRQWWYGSDIRAPVTLACRKSVPIRRTDKHEITGPHRTKQYLFLSNIH